MEHEEKSMTNADQEMLKFYDLKREIARLNEIIRVNNNKIYLEREESKKEMNRLKREAIIYKSAYELIYAKLYAEIKEGHSIKEVELDADSEWKL